MGITVLSVLPAKSHSPWAACIILYDTATKQGKIAWNLPAVEWHFISTEMNVSVFEHLHYFGKQSPQKPVRFAQYWVDWAKQAIGPIPVVVAGCQQMVLSITPWESMPYICSNSHGVNKHYFSIKKEHHFYRVKSSQQTISLQPNNNWYHRRIKASAAHSIGNKQIFCLSSHLHCIRRPDSVLITRNYHGLTYTLVLKHDIFQPQRRQSTYMWIALSSSSSSLKFLEWPKQQRHHEDHYSQSKYSSIRECCNSSGISVYWNGAGRLTGTDGSKLVSCSRP